MINLIRSGLSRVGSRSIQNELLCTVRVSPYSSSASSGNGNNSSFISNSNRSASPGVSTPLVEKKTPYHSVNASQPQTEIQSSGKNDAYELPEIAKISLSEAVPWIPKPIYSSVSESDTVTTVTTLDNGIRVASEPNLGSFCTVGLMLDSGSRYEVAYPSGISHFLEKLAFGDTVNMKREEVMNTFERFGGICDCQTMRDALIYAASVEAKGLEAVVETLSEVVWRPNISQNELEMAQMAVAFDLENLDLSPQKDALLVEMIHKAGYRDNTVGLAKICPHENITEMQIPKLMSYMKHHHSAERMVVAGVGVDHDVLVRAVEKYFETGSAIWDQRPDLLHPQTAKTGVDKSIAQYTGGSCLVEADLSKVSLGPDPLPELCHLVLGLESVNHQHPDFVAYCVLNFVMGGGSSFSAGGPGKGMYTRLYTNVLNKHHWMHSAQSFNHAYSDSGLFCILASAHPSQLHDLAQVLTREMVAMASTITKPELDRAKKQLQSMVLMNLESRPVIFEDMARQVMSIGTRKQPKYYMDVIDAVSLDDVHRVASHMLKSKLSMAAYGSLDRLPNKDTIEAALLHKTGRLGSRSTMSLFR